jgi:three-Cys-motif partner protein
MPMPSWIAQPHTVAKIDILRGYLNAWFPILGSSTPKLPMFYVDGFAGPGRYVEGQEGSPLVALECAKGALISGFRANRWIAGHVYCLFVETKPSTLALLESELPGTPEHAWIHHKTFLGDFDPVLETLRRDYPTAFGDAPLFVFLDPFGPTGLSFKTVTSILNSPKSEVLLHFDADGAARMIRALDKGFNRSSQESLTQVFGDESWRSVSTEHSGTNQSFEDTTRDLVGLYLRRLRSVAGFAYPFQMITPSGTHDSEVGYYLIFATNHPRGIAKMKAVMKTVGQDGRYRFSNFLSRQPLLFNPAASKVSDAENLHQYFQGTTNVTWNQIMSYTLNDTGLISPKTMLKFLEDRGLINVRLTVVDVLRKPSTYPDRLHRQLRFDFREGVMDG